MANEMRLIRAIDVYSLFDMNGKKTLHVVDIDSIQRVDAVEVVHGRWVDRYGGKYANPVYDCSECKKSALYRNDMDLLGNWKSVQYLSDYCPNCGAKMDL